MLSAVVLALMTELNKRRPRRMVDGGLEWRGGGARARVLGDRGRHRRLKP